MSFRTLILSFLLLSVVMLNVFDLRAQPKWQWAVREGARGMAKARKLCVDKQGNTYVRGVFSDTALFGATQLLGGQSGGVFVTKLDPNGKCVWVKRVLGGADPATQPGVQGGTVGGIAVDDLGHCFVNGSFQSSALWVDSEQVLTLRGKADVYLLCFNTENGNLSWAKNADGGASAICTDVQGDIYLAGGFGGTLIIDTYKLVSAGDFDIVVSKYDKDGNVKWAKRGGGPASEIVDDICVDSFGNCFITGEVVSPGPTVAYFDSLRVTHEHSWDVFFAKYDSNGNALWVREGGGENPIDKPFITVDRSGNCLTAGSLVAYSAGEPDTFYFDTVILYGHGEMFLAKYDSRGKLMWAKQPGGVGAGAAGIATDKDDNVIFTGGAGSSAKFDTLQFPEVGPVLFVAKYNSQGRAVWVKGITGGDATTQAIASNGSGDVYITGNYSYESDAPSFDNYELPLDGTIFGNMYVAKLVDDGPLAGTVSERFGHNIFSVYPNPFRTEAIIEFPTQEQCTGVQFRVFNAIGQDVSDDFSTAIFDGRLRVNSTRAIAGTYSYKLINQVSSQPFPVIGTGKFIVQ